MCLDCVALDSERCSYPGCGNLYEMQTPDTLARPENPNPKWPVPKDLIELQPSYKQACLARYFMYFSSFKTTVLIVMILICFTAKNMTHICRLVFIQDNWDPDWQSTSSSKVAYLIHRLKELQDANSEVYRPEDDVTDVQKFEGLLCSSRNNNSNVLAQEFGCFRTRKMIKDKVLVFSQFLEHIHVIEQQVINVNRKYFWIFFFLY